jgi:hypothetical protein
MKFSSVAKILLFVATAVASSQAFAPLAKKTSATTVMMPAARNDASVGVNRRKLLVSTAGSLAGMLLVAGKAHATSTTTTDALISDLETSLEKLKPIPSLLEKNDWDAVRTILKTPPVNQLWNLGDSKNTLQLLAKATDEFGLIDVKDELSLTLQMCDQFTYDNVFVYFQPGTQILVILLFLCMTHVLTLITFVCVTC